MRHSAKGLVITGLFAALSGGLGGAIPARAQTVPPFPIPAPIVGRPSIHVPVVVVVVLPGGSGGGHVENDTEIDRSHTHGHAVAR